MKLSLLGCLICINTLSVYALEHSVASQITQSNECAPSHDAALEPRQAEAAAAAVLGSAALGGFSTALGIIGFPLFVASAVLGILGFLKAHAAPKQGVMVRYWMGRVTNYTLHPNYAAAPIWASDHHSPPDDNWHKPSTIFWNSVGIYLGHEYSRGVKVDEGQWVDTFVETPNTNERPEYIAFAAQENSVECIAGVGLQFKDRSDIVLVIGDIFAACFGKWYYSRTAIGNAPEKPLCVWVDGDGFTDTFQGFSFHIPSMTGQAASQAVAAQRSDNPDLMCAHDARMAAHPKMGYDNFKIRYFLEELPLLANNTDDVDRFWQVPTNWTRGRFGRFTDDGDHMNWCDPEYHGWKCWWYCKCRPRVADNGNRTHYPEKNTTHISNLRSRIKPRLPGNALETKNSFMTELVLDPRSARVLCSHPRSLGPDFLSSSEGLYCHMESKTLWPVCNATITESCFDQAMMQTRPKTLANSSVRRDGSVPEDDIPFKHFPREKVSDWHND